MHNPRHHPRTPTYKQHEPGQHLQGHCKRSPHTPAPHTQHHKHPPPFQNRMKPGQRRRRKDPRPPARPQPHPRRQRQGHPGPKLPSEPTSDRLVSLRPRRRERTIAGHMLATSQLRLMPNAGAGKNRSHQLHCPQRERRAVSQPPQTVPLRTPRTVQLGTLEPPERQDLRI